MLYLQQVTPTIYSLGKPSAKNAKKIVPKEKKFGNFYLLLYLEEIWF